jgi:hypothetical protein
MFLTVLSGGKGDVLLLWLNVNIVLLAVIHYSSGPLIVEELQRQDR